MTRADKVILFDVDGVVLHSGSATARSSRPWLADLRRDLNIDPQRLAELFFTAGTRSQSLMDACATGSTDVVDVLPDVLIELGYTGSVDTFLRYWFEHDAYVDPILISEIDRLRGACGRSCYLATSQEHRRAAYIWDELGLQHHFADMFYSAKLGCSKKSIGFFRAIEAELNLPPKQLLYFDDREPIVELARSAGWEAYLYESVASLQQSPELAMHSEEDA